MCKRIFLINAIALLLGMGAMAQTVTVIPSAFKARDTITIEVDVTGTDVAGIEPLYIWAFLDAPMNPNPQPSPNGVPGGNGSWTSSNEALKMEKVGPNKWQFGMRPTRFFAELPANIVEIGFLIKAKDGSGTPEKKTKNLSVKPDPSVFVETENRVFPPKADVQDVVTINYNQTKATTVNAGRMQVSTVEIAAYDENGTQIGETKTGLSVRQTDVRVYSHSFIPNVMFSPGAVRIASIRYRFGGLLPGTTDTVFSEWAEYQFPVLTY